MGKSNVTQGTTLLLVSQVIFIASGYGLHIYLGRTLGVANYGIFVVILSLMTVVNLILTTGIPQAASKFISENENDAARVEYSITRLQFVFSLSIFIIYFISANQIAMLLNDPSLEDYIRISAFVIPSYAMYSVFAGYLNGRRRYSEQSKATIAYSIAKLTFIFVLVLLGFSVYGAVLGFVLAPIIGLIVGLYCTGFRKSGSGYDFKKIFGFAIPIILFSASMNFIGSIDLFFVKALLPDANQAAGFYSAASQIAKVPYYFMGALFSALFPAISSNIHIGNITKVQMYIKESLRNTLLFLMPVVFILSATSGKIVTLLYSTSYTQAGEPLSILVIGMGLFSIFMLFITIITGGGHPRAAMFMSFVVLALDYVLNLYLVPVYALNGAAIATTIASAVGLIIAGLYTYRRFGVLTYPNSLFKISISVAFIYALSLNVQLSGLLLMVEYLVLLSVYLILLFIIKEIKHEDIKQISSMIRH